MEKKTTSEGRAQISLLLDSLLSACNECTIRKLGIETRKIGAYLFQRFSPHRMFASSSRACNILPCIRTYFWLKGAAAPRVSYLSSPRINGRSQFTGCRCFLLSRLYPRPSLGLLAFDCWTMPKRVPLFACPTPRPSVSCHPLCCARARCMIHF